MKKYQLWVTLEEWEDDDKICDVESCLVATLADQEEGQWLFQAVQDHAIAAKTHLEPSIESLIKS